MILKNKIRFLESRLSFLSFDELAHPIDHILHKLLLRSSKTSLVRDIEDWLCAFRVLTMDSSNLHMVLVCNLLKLLLILR